MKYLVGLIVMFVAVFSVDMVNAGKKEHKAYVCHKGKTLHIAEPAVSAHLNHGDKYGECEEEDSTGDLDYDEDDSSDDSSDDSTSDSKPKLGRIQWRQIH